METRRKMSIVENIIRKLPPWKIKSKEYLIPGVSYQGEFCGLGNEV